MAECVSDLMLDLSQEEIISAKSSNRSDAIFDEIIGHIQDILMDEEFTSVQTGFLEKHYQDFDDEEENKFIYTDIFKEYTKLIESHLERELVLRMPEFEMDKFLQTLESRKNEIGEEIFDMLLSFSDFLTFKQTILDYKAEKEGRSLDLGGLVVSSFNAGPGGGSNS